MCCFSGKVTKVEGTRIFARLDGKKQVLAYEMRIFAVDNGTLYDIDPETGAYESVCGGWKTQHLVGIGKFVYAFEEGGSLYRIAI